MHRESKLREASENCRRMAEESRSPPVKAALFELSRSYEARADRLRVALES
jgi:hypothetical protein